MKEPHSHKRSQGFTLVELIVGMTIAGILSIALIGVVMTWVQQYAAASMRNSMLADTQTASHKISDDIRKSTKLLAENAAADSNAPSAAGKWTSSANTLVLAQTPRTSAGAALYDNATTFTGTPDSIVYYRNGTTLYRRTVPANYTGNATLPLLTCTVSTIGGCPEDIKILDNVSSLAFTYLNSSGTATTTASQATAVSLTIRTQRTVANQPVGVEDTAVMTFRKTQ